MRGKERRERKEEERRKEKVNLARDEEKISSRSLGEKVSAIDRVKERKSRMRGGGEE